MSSESVKVCDVELTQLAKLAECWDDIDAVLVEYVNIMKKVSNYAIKDGNIHYAVDDLYLFAKRFHGFAEGLGAEAAGYANKLVSKIDDIDLNLY